MVTDNIVPGKVALLQGPPFAAELAHQSPSIFPRLQFGDLFVTRKRIDSGQKRQLCSSGFEWHFANATESIISYNTCTSDSVQSRVT